MVRIVPWAYPRPHPKQYLNSSTVSKAHGCELWPTKRETHRQTIQYVPYLFPSWSHNICNNRLHLCTVCMWSRPNSNCQRACMPQIRKPRLPEVVVRHLFIWLSLFSSDASSPCCLVPILRSNIHGSSILQVRFSSSMNSAENWWLWNVLWTKLHHMYTQQPIITSYSQCSTAIYLNIFSNYTCQSYFFSVHYINLLMSGIKLH